MKTKTIKSLKKEVLVIEDSPAIDFYEINPRMLAFNMLDGSIKIFKGNYTLLGKPEEITRDDVMDLVEVHEFGYVKVSENHLNSPLRHFHSAIEKEIYWKNPHGKHPRYLFDENVNPRDIKARCYQNMWKEAQEKTFDRNRTLIFIKN